MQLDITFQVVTPESAENGDAADHGFLVEDAEFTDVEEAKAAIESALGYLPHVEECGSWYATADAETELSTGADTYYNIHFSDDTPIELQKATFEGLIY